MNIFYVFLFFKGANQFEAHCFYQPLSYFYCLFFDIINSSLIKWNKLIIAFLPGDKHFFGHLRGINEYDMAAILKETGMGKEIDD